MDTTFRTPWVEMFRREDADRDVRMQAAQGLLAPRAAEQLALLSVLVADADDEVAAAARLTLDQVPRARIEGLLARADAPADLRAFFAERGIEPGAIGDEDLDTPLVDVAPEPPAVLTTDDVDAAVVEADQRGGGALQKIASLTIPQRLSLAMKGRREERAILIRDSNKLISLSVLSSPKLSESEVETYARMTNVHEDVTRTIAATRGWIKSYAICAALVRNPKTPLGISMNLLQRLNDRDLKLLSTDRNVPEVLRATARRKVVSQKG